MSRSFKKIIKNTLTISLGTLVSRILGFLRDVLIAKFFGTSFLIEAFLVAFRLPNMLRSLLGEGAVDSVVIPVICEYKEDKQFSKTCSHLMLSSFSIL
jgi:putative peptidoglycan lipid II flippase